MSISQTVADLAQTIENEPDSAAKAGLVMATRSYILEVREYMAATIVQGDPTKGERRSNPSSVPASDNRQSPA